MKKKQGYVVDICRAITAPSKIGGKYRVALHAFVGDNETGKPLVCKTLAEADAVADKINKDIFSVEEAQ
jgi:hypothetical protein